MIVRESDLDTMRYCYMTQEQRDAYNRILALAASAARPAEPGLSDRRIIELRDRCLPSQGGTFDCIAFAREVEAEVRAELDGKVQE